jgi:hypothetical protein
MFIKKNTRSANFKKVVSFFIGLFLLSANCLNPSNSKVSAMENENFKKNKETNISINENQVPAVPPLQNNENHQPPLNEEINGGGNGGQENFQNEDSQSSNEGIINSNFESNETNNEENQDSSNQTNLQNANQTVNELYFNSRTSQAIDENSINKKNAKNENELPVETTDNGKIITTDEKNLKLQNVFCFQRKNNMVSIKSVFRKYKDLIKEVFLSEFLIIDNQQMKIVGICSCAFLDCHELTKIIIPNSVLKIGQSAFKSCKKLTTVVLPSFIKSIDDQTFFCCDNLSSITFSDVESAETKVCYLPNFIKNIGPNAFSCCRNLTKVILPITVRVIKSMAFFHCSKLKQIILPEHLDSIEWCSVFTYCENLKYIEIPNNINFKKGNFDDCDALPKIIKNQLEMNFKISLV